MSNNRVIAQSVLEQKVEQICSRTKTVVALCARTDFPLEQEKWLRNCARTLVRFLFYADSHECNLKDLHSQVILSFILESLTLNKSFCLTTTPPQS